MINQRSLGAGGPTTKPSNDSPFTLANPLSRPTHRCDLQVVTENADAMPPAQMTLVAKCAARFGFIDRRDIEVADLARVFLASGVEPSTICIPSEGLATGRRRAGGRDILCEIPWTRSSARYRSSMA